MNRSLFFLNNLMLVSTTRLEEWLGNQKMTTDPISYNHEVQPED